MGGLYSYIKICRPSDGRTIGFVFELDGVYKKYVITTGNGSNVGNRHENTNYNFYYNYGQWFKYDGNAHNLNRVLRKYDPKRDDINEFFNSLIASCNIVQYESTFGFIRKWVVYVVESVNKVAPIATITYYSARLIGYQV